MSNVPSQSSFQNPISRSRARVVHRPDGGTAQESSIIQVVGHSMDTGLHRVPSWPLRKRTARNLQSIPSSQLDQDSILSSPPPSPMHATGEQLIGYDALKRDIKAIFEQELYELRSSVAIAFRATDAPSWVDAFKQDMQTMFRKEFYDMLSSNAFAATERPSWADAFRRDMQTMFKDEFSELARRGSGHEHLRFRDSDAAAIAELERSRAEMTDEEIPEESAFVRDRVLCSDAVITPIPERNCAKMTEDDFPEEDRLSQRFDEEKKRRVSEFSVRSAPWTCAEATWKKAKSNERIHDEAILADLRSSLAASKPSSKQSDRSAFSEVPAYQTSMTITTDSIKQSFRHSEQKPYDVKDMYKEEGFFQALAKRDLFDNCTLVVIVLNTIWLSIDTDLNSAHSLRTSSVVFVVADVVFYTYFFGEILVRFLAFRHKADCCKDGWFVFDASAVILYTLDPFVITIVELAFGARKNEDGMHLPTETLRLLRLGRLTRLTRLLQRMPQMLVMIKGIATALATVVYTLGMLGLVTYGFAIAFRSSLPTDSKLRTEYFSTVLETMHYLVIHGAFLDDLSGFVKKVQNEGVACLILSWLFIILSAMLIMNMLVGVLCQVIATVATEEKERMISEKIQSDFKRLLADFDNDEDGLLGWEEFARLVGSSVVQRALKESDVDVNALVDMAEDMFFYSYGSSRYSEAKMTITFTQVIELILQLRGSKPALVKDVMAIGKRFNLKLHELQEFMMATETPNAYTDP